MWWPHPSPRFSPTNASFIHHQHTRFQRRVFEPTLRCCPTLTSEPKLVEIFWDQGLQMHLRGRSITGVRADFL